MPQRLPKPGPRPMAAGQPCNMHYRGEKATFRMARPTNIMKETSIGTPMHAPQLPAIIRYFVAKSAPATFVILVPLNLSRFRPFPYVRPIPLPGFGRRRRSCRTRA